MRLFVLRPALCCQSNKQRLAEHEACIRDIAELKWQLKLEREKLDHAREKLAHAEVLNQRLHEDIRFAKKQVPIVKENLELQRAIINQINTAQAEVTSNLIHSCFENNSCLYSRSQEDRTLLTCGMVHNSLFCGDHQLTHIHTECTVPTTCQVRYTHTYAWLCLWELYRDQDLA